MFPTLTSMTTKTKIESSWTFIGKEFAFCVTRQRARRTDRDGDRPLASVSDDVVQFALTSPQI